MTKLNILVAVPAYNCSTQISRVIQQFVNAPSELFSELLVIDNQSIDKTSRVAIDESSKHPNLKISVIKNTFNYGLGGSHKISFDYCIKNNFDGLVILHGDDQGNLSDLVPIFEKEEARNFDCILGARFMANSQLIGYQRFRVFGNYIFNNLYSFCTMRKIYDLGAGLNFYNTHLLKNMNYKKMPDDLTFNAAFLLASIAKKKSIQFFPISWREVDQISNVKLWSQSINLLKYLIIFIFSKNKLLSGELRKKRYLKYTYTKLVAFKGN